MTSDSSIKRAGRLVVHYTDRKRNEHARDLLYRDIYCHWDGEGEPLAADEKRQLDRLFANARRSYELLCRAHREAAENKGLPPFHRAAFYGTEAEADALNSGWDWEYALFQHALFQVRWSSSHEGHAGRIFVVARIPEPRRERFDDGVTGYERWSAVDMAEALVMFSNPDVRAIVRDGVVLAVKSEVTPRC